ncbi:hypothetical protein RHMOL_Rhmol01G0208500 [Rhododendron molle]|uniref:Uncharacterized protein n=1 Tax=Rhododendron molle TaxID=49168 RepID=A0ACC0Q555_RHOML|nr:hypothetical protein RHMOL_Rhmol01G0208500 [Rhododendron molle]
MCWRVYSSEEPVCFSSHVKGPQWEEGDRNFLFNGPLKWEKVSTWVLEKIGILDFFVVSYEDRAIHLLDDVETEWRRKLPQQSFQSSESQSRMGKRKL